MISFGGTPGHDKECPTTESDYPPYNHRYFLSHPVKRLQRAGWAQLRFTTSRCIATTFNGEELKDSYYIAGRSMLRLVMDKGTFDYDVPVKINVEEIPF